MDGDGETHALSVSEAIPFLEYELHRQVLKFLF
jgi:hypothetical protein